MIETTHQKIYNFNKPTAVYCQIAVSALTKIYHTKYNCKPEIKYVKPIIQKRLSYPNRLLISKQIKGFIFTTKHKYFEIQLLNENDEHLYINLKGYFNPIPHTLIKFENFIIKDIQQVKSDNIFKEVYIVRIFNATMPPKINSVITPTKISASSENNIR